MRPVVQDITLVNGTALIALAQEVAAGNNFIIDGTNSVGGVARATASQIVTFTPVGNESANKFTVTGRSPSGRNFSETVDGANATAFKTTCHFSTVTQITPMDSTDDNVTVTWLAEDGFLTEPVPVNWRQSPFNMSLTAQNVLTGNSGTVTVQQSVDDPEATYDTSYSTDANWQDVTGLVGTGSTDSSNLNFPVRAVRAGSVDDPADADHWIFTYIQGQNG